MTERVKFTSTGNGYHDVHLDGTHHKHLTVMLDTSVAMGGGRNSTRRLYVLYNKNKQKAIGSGTLIQLKNKLHNVLVRKDNRKLNEFVHPLALMAGAGAAVAAFDIAKTHIKLRKKEAEERAAGKMTYREKRARVRQRIKDKADPKSEVNKNIKRKQGMRRRKFKEIADSLLPGQTTTRKLTKGFAPSNSKVSKKFAETPKRRKKGVRVSKDEHGVARMVYEMFMHLLENRRLTTVKNPPPDRVKHMLKNSSYNELKGIADHTSGHMYVWDGGQEDSNHGDVAEKRKLHGSKISAFTINGHYKAIQHSHEDDSSMPGTVTHASFDEHKKHPKVKEMQKGLGYDHESGEY